jgi:hypothetical protein
MDEVKVHIPMDKANMSLDAIIGINKTRDDNEVKVEVKREPGPEGEVDGKIVQMVFKFYRSP